MADNFLRGSLGSGPDSQDRKPPKEAVLTGQDLHRQQAAIKGSGSLGRRRRAGSVERGATENRRCSLAAKPRRPLPAISGAHPRHRRRNAFVDKSKEPIPLARLTTIPDAKYLKPDRETRNLRAGAVQARDEGHLGFLAQLRRRPPRAVPDQGSLFFTGDHSRLAQLASQAEAAAANDRKKLVFCPPVRPSPTAKRRAKRIWPRGWHCRPNATRAHRRRGPSWKRCSAH